MLHSVTRCHRIDRSRWLPTLVKIGLQKEKFSKSVQKLLQQNASVASTSEFFSPMSDNQSILKEEK